MYLIFLAAFLLCIYYISDIKERIEILETKIALLEK